MLRGRLGPFAVRIPETRRERRRGLLALALSPGEGLLLRRCRSVHTFGMRVAIDAVLLDGRFRVATVVPMEPGRILLPRPGVRHILEVPRGEGPRRGLALKLLIEDRRLPVSSGPGPAG